MQTSREQYTVQTHAGSKWYKPRAGSKQYKLCVGSKRYKLGAGSGSKINQKSIKNGPKIDQKSYKIEVWRAPGQVWRPLGPSWASQSILKGIVDRLGGVMEASWAGKVANMAPTRPQVGAQDGGKIRLEPSWRRLESLLETSCIQFYAFLMHLSCMP